MAKPRKAYFILETQTDGAGELVALIAVEGTKGYYKTNWSWGKDAGLAREIAEQRNEKLGISPDDAADIVISTMPKRILE